MKNRYILLYSCFHLALLGFQPVDVNVASREQVAALPGVGETLAQAIISSRQKQGFFKHPRDLLRVPGLSEKKLAAFEEKIIFSSAKNKPDKTIFIIPPSPQLTAHQKIPLIELSVLEAKVLEAAGLMRDFELDMAKRARHASWLPKITFLSDYDRHDIATERLGKKNDDTSNRIGSSFEVGIRATFNLPETVYHQSELELARIQLKRLEARDKIIAELHKQYFDYDRLNQELSQPQTDEKHTQIISDMKKIANKLDSMSNGHFSRFQAEQVQP